MQAVALASGDDFLLSYNQSIDTNDVLDFIIKLHIQWIQGNYATFDDFYGIDFAQVVGPSGFCYNFNLVDANKLFHLDRWAKIKKSFNYIME